LAKAAPKQLQSEACGSDQATNSAFIALLAATTMLFAAFTSAYLIRRGLSGDWTPLNFPAKLYLSPLLLVLISVMLEICRRGSLDQRVLRACCLCAAALGGLFALLQFFTWKDLLHNGMSAAQSPAAAFFYVLSGAFTVYVAGGVLAIMGIAFLKMDYSAGAEKRLNIVSYYWHYLWGLWSYLLILMYVWS
jgi:cytochrome c oxidase subunit 3